jgi:hypothetical protein
MTRKKNNNSKQVASTTKREVIVKQVPLVTTKRLPRMKVSSSKNPIFGSNNFTSNVDHIPAAFNTICGNSTFLREAGKVKHPMIGIEGIALVGCQPLTDIVTTAANSNLFTSGTLALTSANAIALSPDALNGPLAAQANLHVKYVFRDVILEYVSNVATSQAGSMPLAVVEDGSSVNLPSSFSTTRQVVPSISFPFRSDRSYLHYHYDGMELWYTELLQTTEADARNTIQSYVCGFPSASSIGAVSQGFLNVWYVIELYQPTSSQGFTLQLKSKEERDKVEQYLKEIREEKGVSVKTRLEPRPLTDYFKRIQ